VIAIPLLFWGASGATVITISATQLIAAGALAVGGYLLKQNVLPEYARPILSMPLTMESQEVQDPPDTSKKNKKKAGSRQNNTDVYAPGRPLPLTEDGVHIPDADAPHTQLGTREGSNGNYPQASPSLQDCSTFQSYFFKISLEN